MKPDQLFAEKVNQYNQALAPILNPVIRNLDDANYIRVRVPLTSFNPLFFGFSNTGNSLIVLAHPLEFQTDQISLELPAATTIVDSSEPFPCGVNVRSTFILVSADQLHVDLIDPFKYWIGGEDKMFVRGTYVEGRDHKTYLCPLQ